MVRVDGFRREEQKNGLSAVQDMFRPEMAQHLAPFGANSSLLQRVRQLLLERGVSAPGEATLGERLAEFGVVRSALTRPLFEAAHYLDYADAPEVPLKQLVLWYVLYLVHRPTRVRGRHLGDSAQPNGPWVDDTAASDDGNRTRPVRKVFRVAHPATASIDQAFADRLSSLLPAPASSTDLLRLYHGTSLSAAESIVFGINRDRLDPCCDFGLAFYLTPDLLCALHWMRWPITECNAGALLVYDVEVDKLCALRWVGFEVPGRDVVGECDEGERPLVEWERLVRACRAGDPTQDLEDEEVRRFARAEVLSGPVLENANEVRLDKTQRPLPVNTPWEQYAMRRAEGFEFVKGNLGEYELRVVRVDIEAVRVGQEARQELREAGEGARRGDGAADGRRGGELRRRADPAVPGVQGAEGVRGGGGAGD